MSKLYFFRHAQASFGAVNYDQLSPKGEEQSAILGKYLVEKDFNFDKIFVGPLQRQKHTFEIVADVFAQHKKAIPMPIFVEQLKEHSGPKATRELIPKLMKSDPKIQQWMAEVKTSPHLERRNRLLAFQYLMGEWVTGKANVEGIESWATFRQEVRKGLQHILNQTQKGETIGSFTSGGTISSITAEALNLQDQKRIAEMNYTVRNTSFSSFLYSNNQFNLLSFNELPHLEGEMVTFV